MPTMLDRSREWYGNLFTLGVVCASAVFAYLLVFKFPATPIYIENDSLIFLSDAQRMAAGEVMYRDFFQFTFPGIQVVYRLLFAIAGERFWLLPALIVAITAMTAGTTIAVAKRVIVNRVAVYAPAIILVFFGFRYYGLEGTHRMISPIFILLAVLVLISAPLTKARIALAGALCGFSTFFTQQRGIAAVAAIVVWLLVDKMITHGSWRAFLTHAGMLVAGFLIVITVACGYMIVSAGPATFWNSTVVYPWLYYGAADQNSSGTLLSDLARVFAQTSLPGMLAAVAAALYGIVIPLAALIAAGFVFWRASRDWRKWNSIALLALVWLGLLVSTFGLSPIRLFQISAPALILIFATLYETRFPRTYSRMLATTAAGILAVLAITQVWRTQIFWNYRVLDTPSGTIAFYDGPLADRYEWLIAHTRPGDSIYEARQPYAYFPLQLHNPTPISQVWESDYTRPEHVERVIAGLDNSRSKYVLWEIPYDKPPNERQPGDHLAPLHRYLLENYTKLPDAAWTIEHGSAIEIWERVR